MDEAKKKNIKQDPFYDPNFDVNIIEESQELKV